MMWPRTRRNTAEKRPIVDHMFEQLALEFPSQFRAGTTDVGRVFENAVHAIEAQNPGVVQGDLEAHAGRVLIGHRLSLATVTKRLHRRQFRHQLPARIAAPAD